MKPTVLLVDDDENILHGLARALRKQPYQLHTARSGEEAIWVLKSRDVDVVVADEQMPQVSGSDLLAWIAAHCPETVRIMLTGHATLQTAIRAINEGSVYHFFVKPCDDLQLALTIRKAIEHRALLVEHRRLVEVNQRQTGQLERLTRDAQLLARRVASDLKQPLDQAAESCVSLARQYPDLFDLRAKTLVDRALDAVADIHRLADAMLNRC